MVVSQPQESSHELIDLVCSNTDMGVNTPPVLSCLRMCGYRACQVYKEIPVGVFIRGVCSQTGVYRLCMLCLHATSRRLATSPWNRYCHPQRPFFATARSTEKKARGLDKAGQRFPLVPSATQSTGTGAA